MVNLFSVFDPVSYFYMNLNWIMLGVVWLAWGIVLYYFINNNVLGLLSQGVKELVKTFMDMGGVQSLGLACMSIVFFFIFFVSNVFSLFPFVFTLTAHPSVSMSFGITMMVSFLTMGWFMNCFSMASHLVPCGCPLALAPFMVLIESISILIRPFTLSIRLTANLMAGHLIIGLLSSISQYDLKSFFFSVLFQCVLGLLELGVAVIQSFVFSALIMMYAVESC